VNALLAEAGRNSRRRNGDAFFGDWRRG